MGRFRILAVVLAALTGLWSASGCKVTVAPLDLEGLADTVVADAGDTGPDGLVPDVPSADVLPGELPPDDGSPRDVLSSDGSPAELPSGDVPPTDLPPADVAPTDALPTDALAEDPCGNVLNPACSPERCDDGDPSTAMDTCSGDATLCGCKGIPPLPLPCDGLINPSCNADDCDDGDPSTSGDRCVQDTFLGCTCRGTSDPCSSALNPECRMRQCALGDAALGVCQATTVGDRCACRALNPCAMAKPALTCPSLQCWRKPDVLGMCQGDVLAGSCGCDEGGDPCGSRDNPQCWSNVCAQESGEEGRCVTGRDGLSCKCLPPEDDGCSDVRNPQCKPNECKLMNSVNPGKCMLSPLGLCGCGPTSLL